MKKGNLIPVCGVLMFLSEVWKQYTLTFHIFHGQYCVWYFPFQLCSIAMYLCLLYPFARKEGTRQVLLAFLMDYSLLGGIFVFFDTSGMQYPLRALTIHSYLWHILLIVLGLYAGYLNIHADITSANKVNHRPGPFADCQFFAATCIYGFCCIIATALNLLLTPYGEIDMFYINPLHSMGQRVFTVIAAHTSTPVGIIVYILATITGAGTLHLLWKWTAHLVLQIQNAKP
ncbi:MAG: hypothetical protein PHN80_02905 [Hespellia sp.]|nr:hypothetical protein [Hespellia sp.]